LVRDRVTKVSDGDTVRLERLGSIRLIGVDTPESSYKGKAQPGGKQAGVFLRNMLLNQDVEVELCAKQPYDRYGRGLGFIYATNRSGQRVLVNQEIIRQGYGRVYSLRPCSVDEAEWGALYEEARRARRGLFATIGDVPDAVAFRRQYR
jgi:micrococcal nuclease